MLDFRDITVEYGHARALSGISLVLEAGQITCILGANGAGKSTLLRAASGLVATMGGEIWLDGRRIDGWSPTRIVQAGVIHCPEARRLFEQLTVAENLRMGAWRRKLPFRRLNEDIEFVRHLFPVLRPRWNQRAGTLSGGEQQMVALGRSLMAQPRLLLLDEPSLGLAPRIVQQLFDILPTLKERGLTIALVEQNAVAALRVADRGYVIAAGKVRAAGTASEIRECLESNLGYFGQSNPT